MHDIHVPIEARATLAARVALACGSAACVLALLAAISAAAAAGRPGLSAAALRHAYVHLPALWACVAIYIAMCACAVAALAVSNPLPGALMAALVPTGAAFGLVAFLSSPLPQGGATRGSACAGMLLLIHLVLLAIRHTSRDAQSARSASLAVVMVGLLNIPIVHVWLIWWNGLQGLPASAMPSREMARTLLAGTWLAASALGLHAAAVAMLRLRRDLAAAGDMEGR